MRVDPNGPAGNAGKETGMTPEANETLRNAYHTFMAREITERQALDLLEPIIPNPYRLIGAWLDFRGAV